MYIHNDIPLLIKNKIYYYYYLYYKKQFLIDIKTKKHILYTKNNTELIAFARLFNFLTYRDGINSLKYNI